MKSLLLLCFFLQAEESIPRADRKLYLNAAKECEKAGGLVASSPAEAVQILNSLLENEAIRKRECILRIELQPGTYSRKYNFFPHQFRGRARMRLAEKADDKEYEIDLLRKARKDFKESVRLGLPTSKALLEQAEKILAERSKPEKPLPPAFSEADFRRTWESYIRRKEYGPALKYVEEKGSALPKERRDYYRAETRRECLDMVSTAVQSFQGNLLDLETISKMNDLVFKRKFKLPEKIDLVEHPPAYLWSLSVRETLSRFLEGEEILDDLFRLAIAAVPLEPGGHFQSMENFAGSIVGKNIAACAAAARDAPLPERNALRKKAKALRTKWETFEADLARATRDRSSPLERISPPMLDAKFPVEWEGRARLFSEFVAGAREKNPDLALERIEERLTRLKTGWKTWSIESRRSLLRFQIAVGATRGFLSGQALARIVGDQRRRGIELKSLNGSFEAEEFGPKIQKVFNALRKS